MNLLSPDRGTASASGSENSQPPFLRARSTGPPALGDTDLARRPKAVSVLGVPVTPRVDPAFPTFGEAWNQNDFQSTLPLENVTDERLKISRIKGSCYYARVKPSAFSIEPGSTVESVLTLARPSGAKTMRRWLCGTTLRPSRVDMQRVVAFSDQRLNR